MSTNPGMDVVRTTQEQLSTNPLDEALNALKLFKKLSESMAGKTKKVARCETLSSGNKGQMRNNGSKN